LIRSSFFGKDSLFDVLVAPAVRLQSYTMMIG
jgi:hypothetical protein